MKIGPRRKPCASCPFRRDVPSGVWAATEYDKLLAYDGTTGEQAGKGAFGVFMCHQGGQEVCSGWASVHGNDENLALRMAGRIDPEIDVAAVQAYTSPVPLFTSSAEAAEHGKRDIDTPDPEAMAAVEKIATVRELRGQPVTYKEPPLDPGNPEARLLRAIYGLCPVCDHDRDAHYGDDYTEHHCRECEKENAEGKET